jgi:septal ring factor EnvC (AmiA/AmiB activator)
MIQWKNILKPNSNFLIFIFGSIFIFFILYWLFFVLTPNIKNTKSEKQIDSLSVMIKGIEKKQIFLNDKIQNFNKEINSVEMKIEQIKFNKNIIKEIYYEKINSIDTYNDVKIDSFFTNRYSDYRTR